MSPLSHALELAARGWAVFPCGTDKAPRCPRGFHLASTDPGRIEAMHVQYGFVLVGIRTGEASNLAVLDVDRAGETWWRENRHRLPDTRAHRTRSKGLHVLYRHAPDLRCSASKIAPGIDVRAEGGYVIDWPSAGFPVLDYAPLADWPAFLTTPEKPISAPWTPPPTMTGDKARNYAAAALRRAVVSVAGTGDGGRNATLNSETFGLSRFIASGALSPDEIAGAMAHAGIAAGLNPREISATIASALGSAAR